jgi:hypothetical protein
MMNDGYTMDAVLVGKSRVELRRHEGEEETHDSIGSISRPHNNTGTARASTSGRSPSHSGRV